jgi:hypothetical protein
MFTFFKNRIYLDSKIGTMLVRSAGERNLIRRLTLRCELLRLPHVSIE